MSIPSFSEDELIVAKIIPPFRPGAPEVPYYSFPMTPKESVRMLYQGQPVWQSMLDMGVEWETFMPGCVPDNDARCMIMDGSPMKFGPGGFDMFGVEWVFVPTVGGATVKPGNPLIKDTSELRTKLVWPDVQSWDWEGNYETRKAFLKKSEDRIIVNMLFTGWFERLVSLMDFENALVAMIDEDSYDDLLWFYDKLSDLYIEIIDKELELFPEIDVFTVHDDWGSSLNSFFAPEYARELIVPAMKKVTDHIKSKGRYANLHSCGKIENMVPCIIEAGWQSWSPQVVNDIAGIYEQYGDQIIIGTMPEIFDPFTTSEADQRRIAKEYAEKYCHKNKPSGLSCNINIAAGVTPFFTDTFREELYRQSRINYLKG